MGNRSDTFDRADTTSSLGTPSDGGSAWVSQSGDWRITSNKASKYSPPNTWSFTTLEASTDSVDLQVTVTAVGDGAGLLARYIDTSNYLFCDLWGGTGLRIYKRVAGSYTSLGSYTHTPANGDVIKFTLDSSNNLKGYLNGTQRIDAGNDSFAEGNTKHGLLSYAGGLTPTWDDFSLTDTSSAAATSFSRRSSFPLSILNL